jgi:hypothetical protein
VNKSLSSEGILHGRSALLRFSLRYKGVLISRGDAKAQRIARERKSNFLLRVFAPLREKILNLSLTNLP